MSTHKLLSGNLVSGVIFILLFFLFLPDFSFAQTKKETGTGFFRAYVITSQGDSLKGYINIPARESRTGWVRFKPNMNSQEKSYDPFEIRSFGSSDGKLLYRSVEIPIYPNTELSFVRQIVEGPYNIYTYRFLNFDHVLLQGSGQRIYDVTNPPDTSQVKGNITISREKFNRYLRTVFSEDPEIATAIGSIQPTRSSIVKSILKYYDQRGLPYKVYGIRQVNLYLGVSSGVSLERSAITINNKELKSFLSFSPDAGILLGINDRKSGLGAVTEGTLSYRSLHYYLEDRLPVMTFYYEGFRKDLLFNARLGISYDFRFSPRFQPVLEAGGLASSSLKSESHNYIDLYVPGENIIYSTSDNVPVMSSKYYGAYIRAGLTFRHLRHNSVRLTGAYERLWNNDNTSLSAFRVQAAYLFKYQ